MTDRPIQQFSVVGFRGGVNTSLPPNEIADDEAVDILNFEFDWSGNLITRNGVTRHQTNESYSTRITSSHDAVYEGGQEFVLYTTDNDLFRVNIDGSSTSSIGGALTLPTNTFWQWKNFEGFAIGVNRATSGDNPVKVNSSGTASALGGTPPKAKYIEVWNNRVWVVSATEPNQVRASALGLPEDWTTAGAAGAISIDVDPGDGDEITGLLAFKERLFVLKRKRIFVIEAVSPPITDPANLRVDVFNANLGCVSAYTIQAVLDDVLFLTEGGIASLTSAEVVADFRSSLVSRKVSEIGRIKKISDEFASLVLDDVSQYWLSVPANLSVTGSNVVYVLDYTELAERVVRWTRFEDKVCGTSYTSFLGGANKVYLVGGQESASVFRLYRYVPRDSLGVFSDDEAAYLKLFKTAAYDLYSPLFRKHFWKWGFGFRLINSPVAVTIQYAFDLNESRGGVYGYNLEGATGQSLWNVMEWGDNWASAVEPVDRDVVRDFHKVKPGNPPIPIGQDAQNVTFVVSNSQAGQAFLVKDFILLWSFVTELGVNDV